MAQSARQYQITNEVLNSVTHGIGIILSIVAFVFLMLKAYADGQPSNGRRLLYMVVRCLYYIRVRRYFTDYTLRAPAKFFVSSITVACTC